MSNFIIQNPSHDVIYLTKERPLIFNQQYNLKHKKKQFDDIYSSPIFKQLSFLISNQFEPCECLISIEQCPKLKEILKQNKRYEAKCLFDQLKHQASVIPKNNTYSSLSIQNQVLQPHFQSLLTVIKTQNLQIITQLLRHLKTDYTTFWIYGLYLSKFPSFDQLFYNIAQIVGQRNLDIDLQGLMNESEKRLQIAYESRLLSIFKFSFPSIVNIVCKSLRTQMIIQKLLICHFVRGRQRKEIEIIKAAMEM